MVRKCHAISRGHERKQMNAGYFHRMRTNSKNNIKNTIK